MASRAPKHPFSTGVVLALLAFAAPALAETPEEAAQRLDDCLFYARELGRGGDTLVVDIEDSLARLGKSEPLLRLRADACVWRGESLLSARDAALEDPAIGYLERVADDAGAPAEFVTRAVGGLVEVHVRRGARLEATDARKALDEYEKAIARNQDDPRPYDSIGGLTARTAEADIEAQRYDEALADIARNRKRIAERRGDDAEAVKRLDTISRRVLSSTTVLDFRWLGELEQLKKVKGGLTVFVGGELRFDAPRSGAAPLPVKLDAGATRRVPRGEFTATLTGRGATTLPLAVKATGESATLTVPTAVPDGMVIVPGTPELPAFLIDRTEVSVAAFRPFAKESGVSFVDDDPNLPARGMTYEDATRFAAWSGKRLPDRAQFRRAALGTPDGALRTHPWGDTDPVPGRHVVGMGVGGPRAVDACPDGASAFGCLNLLGNVMEWITPGWALGGAYSMPGSTAHVLTESPALKDGWTLDFLADPIPTRKAFVEGNLPEGRTRDHYPDAAQLTDAAKLERVGLRCVIPLGQPRERP